MPEHRNVSASVQAATFSGVRWSGFRCQASGIRHLADTAHSSRIAMNKALFALTLALAANSGQSWPVQPSGFAPLKSHVGCQRRNSARKSGVAKERRAARKRKAQR